MDPLRNAERRRARGERLAVPPSGDRHVQARVVGREACDGLQQVPMPFHRKERTHRDDQDGASGEPELFAQRSACRWLGRDAVRNRRDARPGEPDVTREPLAYDVGNGDHGIAQHRSSAQCQPPPQAIRVIASAVHREHVGDSGLPRRPRTVERHRELVTVRDGDLMALERAREFAGERGREWPRQVIMLHTHSHGLERAREPAVVPARQERHARPALRGKGAGEVYQHPLGPTQHVGLDQMCHTTRAHGGRDFSMVGRRGRGKCRAGEWCCEAQPLGRTEM